MIDILIFLIWGIEGAMLYVNIMVKSSDILKTPSQSFFPNNMVGRRVGGGGITVVGAKDTRAIEINTPIAI